MNQKGVIILVAATALAAAAAYFAVSSRAPGERSAGASGALFEIPAARVNAVASIQVQGKGKSATVRGSGVEWRVEQLGGYPAKFESVKKAIVGITSLTRLEPKTSTPALYGKIGVQDPGPESDSTLVTLADAEGKPVASLIVGKPVQGASKPSTFVRVAGEAQSWLVEGSVSAPADPLEWVEREVVALDTNRMHSVIITHPGGDRVEIVRGDQPNTWQVLNVPEGRRLQYDSIGSMVATALSWTSLTDVKAAEGFEWDDNAAVRAEYRTNDGLALTVATIERDGTSWARFSAAADAPAESPGGAPVESPGGSVQEDAPQPPETPAEQPAPAGQAPAPPSAEEEARKAAEEAAAAAKAQAERIAQEAADLNTRLAPWVFAFDKGKADQFRKRMADLLAAPEPPPAPEGEQPEQPTPFQFPGGEAPPPP